MFMVEFVPGVVLLTMLYGSEERCERVFRFLRWTKDRPEPAMNPRHRPVTRAPVPANAVPQLPRNAPNATTSPEVSTLVAASTDGSATSRPWV
jgi:hypothetical protein